MSDVAHDLSQKFPADAELLLHRLKLAARFPGPVVLVDEIAAMAKEAKA